MREGKLLLTRSVDKWEKDYKMRHTHMCVGRLVDRGYYWAYVCACRTKEYWHLMYHIFLKTTFSVLSEIDNFYNMVSIKLTMIFFIFFAYLL